MGEDVREKLKEFIGKIMREINVRCGYYAPKGVEEVRWKLEGPCVVRDLDSLRGI